jgi:hypothetical protein
VVDVGGGGELGIKSATVGAAVLLQSREVEEEPAVFSSCWLADARERRRARCRDRAPRLLRLVLLLELSRTLDMVDEAGWTRRVRRGAVPLGCEEANHEVTHGRE